MTLFLGVDGGQSSTTALIGDESGRVLGMGVGGPCNHVEDASEGRSKFVSAIGASVGLAAASAGLALPDVRFVAACLGFSGGPDDKRALLEQMLSAGTLIVTNDASIALSGATAGEPGIITIAGTGSIAYGRNASGKVARAGGWGYVYGDEGGGFDLARQALRAALREEEGWGPATLLRSMLLEATGAPSANDLLHRFYGSGYPRARVAGFAKLVDEAARAGDSVAQDILHSAGQQLASLTGAVRQRLFDAGAPAPVAYVGGVFRSWFVLERFRMLVELTDGAVVRKPVHGPAAGALLEAYSASGLRPELSGYKNEKTDS